MANSDSLQFWIGSSSGPNRQSLITKISSASINLQLNNGGSVSLTIDKKDITANTVATPVIYCIMVYRDGNLVWSGPIWTVEETASDTSKVTITAVGWFELLNHRLLRTQPSYLLQASAISVTNNSFTGPSSTNWSAIQSGTTCTITAVASPTDTGATLRLSQTAVAVSTSGPPFPYVGASTSTFSGGSFVVGKRYIVNFRLRKEFSIAYGDDYPVCEVIQNSVTIATKICDDAGDATGTFSSFSFEFTAAATTATIRFRVPVGPPFPLMGNWDNNSGWNFTTGSIVSPGVITGSFNGYIMTSTGFDGIFRAGQTYSISTNFVGTFGGATTLAYTVWDGDGYAAGATLYSLGPTSASSLGVTTSWSPNATFTASSSSITLRILISSATGNLAASGFTVSETGAVNRPIAYIDTISPLQELNGDGIYSNQDAGAIAQALLAKTNSDSLIRVAAGSSETTQPRTRTYQQFANVGKEIKALSDIESGYDFKVDPVTRTLDIYNRTNASNFPTLTSPGQAGGSGSWTYSANRTHLRFDYGTGADNLKSVTKTQDASTIVNRINVKGKYALGFAQDITSQNANGLFEDLVSLPDVVDATTSSVLPYYANAEIAFRKNPKITYNIETKSDAATPKLFIDFNIGDRGILNIGGPVLASQNSVPISQTIRIFGVQLSVDSEGNEHISGLQLSA